MLSPAPGTPGPHSPEGDGEFSVLLIVILWRAGERVQDNGHLVVNLPTLDIGVVADHAACRDEHNQQGHQTHLGERRGGGEAGVVYYMVY